jgi:hypothetical protein
MVKLGHKEGMLVFGYFCAAANPNCVIWLTGNNAMSPDVVNSDMYKQTHWLMNERGDKKSIDAVWDAKTGQFVAHDCQ